MKIENINTYNQKEFKEKFEKTNLYKLIHNDYDYISWDKN